MKKLFYLTPDLWGASGAPPSGIRPMDTPTSKMVYSDLVCSVKEKG